jgi:hypothetical protein
MANTDVQAECPLPPQTTWNGARRWSAAFGLTAAVAMGSLLVACGAHGKAGPTATTTTTTTTAPAAGDHNRGGGEPVEPAPGGSAPGTTVTQTVTPGPPTYVLPPLPPPGDYSPFGEHWFRRLGVGATAAQ